MNSNPTYTNDDYHKASKEGAAVCNKAHLAASQQYDRDLEPHRKAMRAAYGTSDYNAAYKLYENAMFTLDKKYDVACQKADKIYAAVMRQAGEALRDGMPTRTEQMTLWSEVGA